MPSKRFRRGRLAPLAAAIAAALGIGAAVAVAAVTTTTATQCATTTAPTHTVGVDGAGVATVGGDTLSVCATATATATDQTVTTTVPGPTTTVTTTVGTTTTAPQPALGGTAGIGLENYGHLSTDANTSGYRYVIGNAWDSDATVTAKVAGLGLAYFAGTDVNTGYSTGVPYSQASSNGWLLSCGASLCANASYPNNYIGDVGSAGYQNAWVTNVENYLAARPGIDGVFIDDTVYDPKQIAGAYPTKYPSTSAWSAAMVSFAKAVYTALHADGYYVALNANAFISGDANSNTSVNTQTWWKMVGPYADGLMDEYYDETADGTDTLRASGTDSWKHLWESWQQIIPLAQSQGDDFLGLTKSKSCTDTNTMTYGRGSFLLEWSGQGGAFMFNCGSGDPSNAAWTADIGTPTAAKVAVGVGYQRAYTGGTVLVNPSPSSSQTFAAGGTSYTLAPTTAKIIAG